MKMRKKVMAMVLAVIAMTAGFTGCYDNQASIKDKDKADGSRQPNSASSNLSADGGTNSSHSLDLSEKVKFTLVFGEHAIELYHEDTWVIAPWVKKKYNVDLDITAVPADGWEAKYNKMLSSNTIPDLLMGVSREDANEYGSKGKFLNLYDYLDVMPNLQQCMDEFPLLKAWMYHSDHEIYSQPATITTKGTVNQSAYYIQFIRRDILTKCGITEMPKTFDELYRALKAMKQKYPKSYPWINRQKLSMIVNSFAPGLGIAVSPAAVNGSGWAVWNEDGKTFTSIMEEENFRWFLGWMNMLYREGLLDPDYATDDTSSWQDKLVGGKGFFSVDYFSRPDTMNLVGQYQLATFELEGMLPPTLEDGQQKIFANVGIGGSNAFSAKCKNPERLAAMLDGWFFSEEGCLLTTYGVENKTYKKNADGTLTRIYNNQIETSLDFEAGYGVNYLTFYAFKPDFFGYDLYDWDQSGTYKNTWKRFENEQIDLPPTIFRNVEEAAAYAAYGADMEDAIMKVFNEFISGRRDVNSDADWRKAAGDLAAAGYDTFLQEVNTVYQRIYG